MDDPATGWRMVQWVTTATSIVEPPQLPYGGGPLADGIARGANLYRRTEVEVSRKITTVWFDRQGRARQWQESRR
jgi:hypothetical protein